MYDMQGKFQNRIRAGTTQHSKARSNKVKGVNLNQLHDKKSENL